MRQYKNTSKHLTNGGNEKIHIMLFLDMLSMVRYHMAKGRFLLEH